MKERLTKLTKLIKEAQERYIYAEEQAQYLIDNGVDCVKHGEWVVDGYFDYPCVCSHCGEEAQYVSTFKETFDYDWEENLQSTGYEEHREYIRTLYCPHCGAKMDGGR